jgi:micrococcal nuclease
MSAGGASRRLVGPLVATLALLCLLSGCRVAGVPPAGTAGAGPAGGPEASYTPGPGASQARVVRVVDGDTIIAPVDGREQRVRYIGVNTPESVDPRREVQCFGKEAAARNAELVRGQTVSLEKDVSETDQYGRLLRYVSVDGRLINAALIREGYARVVTYPPDVRFADEFRRLEREAREAKRGLWGACP